MTLLKAQTGISGLDDILEGGIPVGRATLIAGAAGCGKSLLGQTIILHGASACNEPGIIVTFEEGKVEIIENSKVLCADTEDLIAQKMLIIDEVRLPSPSADFQDDISNLGGIVARIEYHVREIGARRILIDSIESLFASFPKEAFLRKSMRQLVQELKSMGLTVIVTGERGGGLLTRHGFEEYIADCVLFCDHRVEKQLSTRRLRVVKYRGSANATDEFPFVITEKGLSILPITSLSLNHLASSRVLTTGHPSLDNMLGGGIYEGSSVLVEGTAGTGKTSISAALAVSFGQEGRPALYISFEESPAQLERNMRSIGLDIHSQLERGLLNFHCFRPSAYGLETHLARIEDVFKSLKPALVVLDPVSSLLGAGNEQQTYSMLSRLLDIFRKHLTTVVLTSLKSLSGPNCSGTAGGISSIVDCWIDLSFGLETNQAQTRILRVIKARGLPSQPYPCELLLSSTGLQVVGARNMAVRTPQPNQ